jgi:hypothetical protein
MPYKAREQPKHVTYKVSATEVNLSEVAKAKRKAKLHLSIRQCNGGFLSGETKHSVEPDGDTGFDSQTYEDEVKVIKC